MGDSSALSIKRSRTSRARKSPQPSARAVVCPSSTTAGTPFSTERIVLISLLAGFTQEILSEDKLRLSIYAAKPIAMAQGVSEADFNKYADVFFEMANKIRKCNPIAGMF